MDHLRAMIKLGFMHFYGEGCEKEIPLACKYVDYLLKLKDFEKDSYDYYDKSWNLEISES